MSELGFDWNTKKIKSVKLVNGQQTVVELSPKEIINDPNRHRVESIIHALCISINQLIEAQELQAARIQSMLSQRESPKESQVEQ